MDARVERTWWVLRITFGVVPIVAGLDKFTNLLTHWSVYLSPLVARFVAPEPFMRVAGVIEIVAGILVLTRFTRPAAWLVAAWLVGIALNLLSTGHFFDVAVRDLVMAVGAFALAQLSAAREAAQSTARPAAPIAEERRVAAAR